jgi:flagellar biosynthesis repressor protein FlbT
MTLKLNLASNESLLIGKVRVQNVSGCRISLAIHGRDKILRESRIMQESEATTPAKRYYYVVLSLYLADDKESLYNLYHDVARELVLAYPVLTLPVTEIGQRILNDDIYEALNCAHLLVEFEARLQSPPSEESGNG